MKLERHGREQGVFYVENGIWRQWADEKITDLACEVSGRTTGPGAWLLEIQGQGEKGGLHISIGTNGDFRIEGAEAKPKLNPHVNVPWIVHPAIHSGAEFNTALVIVRNRVLEMYVNGRAVYNPIRLDRDITPATLSLGISGQGPNTRAEFQRFTVWPKIEPIPSLAVRAVIPEPGPVAPPPPGVERALRYSWPADRLRQGKIPAPDFSKVKTLFHDDFKNPKSGFVSKTGPLGGGMGYQAGRYQITFASGGFGAKVSTLPLNLDKPGQGFAFQIEGRATGQRSTLWGLSLYDNAKGQATMVLMSADGKLYVSYPKGAMTDFRDNEPSPVGQAKMKRNADGFFTLLVVIRGRQLELYVNSIAVADPILLDWEMSPTQASLVVHAPRGMGNAGSEYRSVTVWSAAGIPLLAERGATAKGSNA